MQCKEPAVRRSERSVVARGRRECKGPEVGVNLAGGGCARSRARRGGQGGDSGRGSSESFQDPVRLATWSRGGPEQASAEDLTEVLEESF